MDYSAIQNENCGKTREMKMKAVDVICENIQDQVGLLHISLIRNQKLGGFKVRVNWILELSTV